MTITDIADRFSPRRNQFLQTPYERERILTWWTLSRLTNASLIVLLRARRQLDRK